MVCMHACVWEWKKVISRDANVDWLVIHRPTSCQVSNPPVSNLQFVINRKQGTAKFNIEKIGQPISNESGESGKNLLLGTFALLYVVEGNVRIELDENHLNGCVYTLNEGQTLFIERDEEASPTSILVKPCDKSGTVGHPDLGMSYMKKHVIHR